MSDMYTKPLRGELHTGGYPITDVTLKRGKELGKTVLVTLSGKILL